ncbi:MAG: DUF4446 family protein [Candidatus Pacebacteria bacterium]|nr:DUF4446 family protein [Candidatus Paceibacterota bacterium]MDD2757438.1 DUF4446 family protein [Candidatus Paceibacterota bacterium]MDD3283960.1 DUF4446 family protein [Candidatus Paceibacterota bacterium]MDD3970152.1 DUF4446 family protein [Candidatus Paceibacterota bacterium]MDD4738237.1 DUF4446 family protein [Candidatus Paceibacterota bacterium]
MFLFNKKKKKIDNVEDAARKIEELELRIEELSLEIDKMQKESELYIQKAKLIRYNPFNEMGGDQSFTLALLNKSNDGIVITSIFNQEKSRVFGKELSKGKSTHCLSTEEKSVIDEMKKYGKENRNN